MKKIVALILVLCMMLAAFPVFAESTGDTAPAGSDWGDLLSGLLGGSDSGESGSGGFGDLVSGLLGGSENGESGSGGFGDLVSGLLGGSDSGEGGNGIGDLLSGLLGGSEGGEGTEGGLGSLFSGLMEELKKDGEKGLSGLTSVLEGTLSKALKDPDGKFATLFSALTEKLNKGGSVDLDGLLGTLLGSGASVELSPEDEEDLAETLDRLNREAEAATGEDVPNRKDAESVEEFYGQWKESRFIYDNKEYDLSEYGEGAFIGENTYYITQDGQKSPDYYHPETAELTIHDGVLKINSDVNWTTYALTQDGEIVMCGSSILYYFVRAD